MARQFLLDFSDSNIRDVAYVMRNFEPGCYGTADETDQVTRHRQELRVINSSVGNASVTVNFGGACPFRLREGNACAQIPVFWDSIRVKDGSREPAVKGTDQVAATYFRNREWRLCDSQFDGVLALHLRKFYR